MGNLLTAVAQCPKGPPMTVVFDTVRISASFFSFAYYAIDIVRVCR